MTNIEVIGLGALNIDHIYQVERILQDGEAIVEKSAVFPGGSAANTIYGLLKEKDLEECGHLGDIVAQFSITKSGARPGLPTPGELSQRYQKLYNKQL